MEKQLPSSLFPSRHTNRRKDKETRRKSFLHAGALLSALISCGSLLANPSGPSVIAGHASFAENSKELSISTQGRTIIDWDRFSIDAHEITRFLQDAPVLNRVVGKNPSALYGLLEANGEIYLLNPQGVIVGRDAVIQTAGFIASTLNIDNNTFLAGGRLEFYGDSIASITFEGTHNVVEEAGRFYLVSNDLTQVSGTVFASEVRVLGDKVHLTETARIEAPEGEVLIGGDFQGKNDDILNAKKSWVDAGARISVDGTENGGRVIIWADESTYFAGSISGTGFNGGFAEVSGKEHLAFCGQVDLKDKGGRKGNLLLDPQFILIQSGGADPVAGQTFGYMTGTTQTIDGSTLAAAISGSSVTLQANSDITIDDNVLPAMAGNLTCEAGCSIIFNAARTVNLNGGTFAATINYDTPPVVMGDRTCPVTTVPQFLMNAGSSIVTNGGAVTINHQMYNGMNIGEVILDSASISAGPAIISITGHGDASGNTIGIHITNSSSLSTTMDGSILLNGTGALTGISNNYGVFLSNSSIAAVDGAISITGTGGGSGAGMANRGVYLLSNTILSTGTGPSAATITITGSGGAGTSGINRGIEFGGGTLSSRDGDISLVGTGGEGNDSVGVFGAFSFTSLGTGMEAANISITGSGGPAGSGCHGIQMINGPFTSVDGNIGLNGTGGGTGAANMGILISNGIIQISGAGTISATGQGGPGTNFNIGFQITGLSNMQSTDGDILLTGTSLGTGDDNYGITVTNTATTIALGAGSVTFNGTGGTPAAGNSNHGIIIGPSTGFVQVQTGSISFTGTGQGMGIDNCGIVMNNSNVQTFGTGPAAGTITMIGTGGMGTDNNIGIICSPPFQPLQAVDGDISLTGTGQGTGQGNYGISISGAGILSSGNTADGANITLIGQGSLTGTNNNVGISGGPIVSVIGDISLTGTGGGSGTGNRGISTPSIQSTGMAPGAAGITLIGQGSISGTDSNTGITGGSITSLFGDIDLQGTGGGSGMGNAGIETPVISSSGMGAGAATIALTGQGAAGTDQNVGVLVAGSISSVDGSVVLTGAGAGSGVNNDGISVSSSTITTTGTGTITLISQMDDLTVLMPIMTTAADISLLAVNTAANISFSMTGDISCGGGFIAAANNNITIDPGITHTISGNAVYIVDEQSGTMAGPGVFTNNGTISVPANLAIYAASGPIEPAGLTLGPVQFSSNSPMTNTIGMWDLAIPGQISLNAKYSTSYQGGGPYAGPGFGTTYLPGQGVFGSEVVWYKYTGIVPTPPGLPLVLPSIQTALSLIGVNTLIFPPQNYLLIPYFPCPILPCIEICSGEEISLHRSSEKEKTKGEVDLKNPNDYPL